MKKSLLKILIVVLTITLSMGIYGCNLTPGDVNDIVDNYFQNYENMGLTESGAYSKFKDINVQSSYLGYGYDVINDPYMDVKKINLSYPIIDMNKIENVNLMMQKVNHGDFYESSGSTIEEFYTNYATSVNVYGNIGKFFSGGLKLDFNGSTSQKSYWYFYKLSYYFDSFYISITDTIDQLQSVLSDNFKNDVISMPIDQLFDRYGTHLIKQAAMGGRIEKSVTYSSESENSKSSMDMAVSAHINILSSSINAEVSTENENELNKAGVTSSSKITQLGGKAISLADNVDYSKWASSFDESLEYSTLSGIVSDNSLIGLWDLLPAGYEIRANEMKNRFIELSGNNYNQILNMYQLNDVAEEEIKDTSWQVITEKMPKYNCHDNKDYSENQKNSDEFWYKIHDGWELGELNLYGFEKENDKYIVKNPEQISLKYKLLQNIDNLPLLVNTVMDPIIRVDTAKKVSNTNINNQEIGRGAFWIRISYADDTQTEINKTNFLDGKTKGSYIDLLTPNDIEQSKTIKKIELVLVYELEVKIKGTVFSTPRSSNWRCEYVLNF